MMEGERRSGVLYYKIVETGRSYEICFNELNLPPCLVQGEWKQVAELVADHHYNTYGSRWMGSVYPTLVLYEDEKLNKELGWFRITVETVTKFVAYEVK